MATGGRQSACRKNRKRLSCNFWEKLIGREYNALPAVEEFSAGASQNAFRLSVLAGWIFLSWA